MLSFDPARVETPAYVIDLALLKRNLELLARVQREAGCKVLLALKGFSMYATFPLVRQYLSGCCASGLNEALLAHHEFKREVHVYSPAFKDAEMRQVLPIADHLSFNSIRQWEQFKPMIQAEEKAPSCGLRVNPEYSEVEVELYNPCSPGCRLGIRAVELENADFSGIEGLHFHALCEQNSDTLERVLNAVEEKFPRFLAHVKWVNMGGGHHITRDDYDIERLIRVVKSFRERHGVDVYLEPGEAVALNTGYLVASVLDIVGGAIPLENRPSKANHKPNEPHIPHPLRNRIAKDSRRAAAALRNCIADTARGVAGADASQRLHAEAESIRHWAEQNGWLIPAAQITQLAANAEELEGGSEHDVLLPMGTGRVWKLTLAPNFGARGEAHVYLENILLVNELFADDWRFEGVVDDSDGLRIVTSQPFINGRMATEDEIAGYFAALGFSREREHTFRRADGLTVADARPANILCDDTGAIIPIDVHVLAAVSIVADILAETEEEESAPVPTAILDVSATCHMPDVLEMPYRPHIIGVGKRGEFPHCYKLGGTSCLAGDVIGEYSFAEPLAIGQKLVFTDMGHYTMVKTTTFNGVPHPDLATFDPATDELLVVRRFGYEDFRDRLS